MMMIFHIVSVSDVKTNYLSGRLGLHHQSFAWSLGIIERTRNKSDKNRIKIMNKEAQEGGQSAASGWL